MVIIKQTILFLLSLFCVLVAQTDLIIEKADLMHLSGLNDEAKLLLIKNIDENQTDIDEWGN